MRENLSILSISPDSEALHQLRLHAKKIRTIELLSELHKHHFTAPLKLMVQQAGDTRSAELTLQTLEKFDYQNGALKQELNAIAGRGYEAMLQNSEQYKEVIDSVNKELEKQLDDIKEERVIAFFILLVEELGAALLWPVQEKDLHENRKRLKNLLYAYRFLPKKMREKFDFNEKYLDNLQEQIGQWHDLEMALVLLEEKGLKHEPVYTAIKKKQEEMFDVIKKQAQMFSQKTKVKHGKA